MCEYLTSGLGFQKEVGWYRASMVDLQGCLGDPEDYSFPKSLGCSSSITWMLGCVQLVKVQSQARWPFLQQQKHPPSHQRQSCSFGVSLEIASSSMGVVPLGDQKLALGWNPGA